MDSQSGSSTAMPSASEQHSPLPLLSVSNHGLSGDPVYRPSSRAVAVPMAAAIKSIAELPLKNLPALMFTTGHEDDAIPWVKFRFDDLNSSGIKFNVTQVRGRTLSLRQVERQVQLQTRSRHHCTA